MRILFFGFGRVVLQHLLQAFEVLLVDLVALGQMHDQGHGVAAEEPAHQVSHGLGNDELSFDGRREDMRFDRHRLFTKPLSRKRLSIVCTVALAMARPGGSLDQICCTIASFSPHTMLRTSDSAAPRPGISGSLMMILQRGNSPAQRPRSYNCTSMSSRICDFSKQIEKLILPGNTFPCFGDVRLTDNGDRPRRIPLSNMMNHRWNGTCQGEDTGREERRRGGKNRPA